MALANLLLAYLQILLAFTHTSLAAHQHLDLFQSRQRTSHRPIQLKPLFCPKEYATPYALAAKSHITTHKCTQKYCVYTDNHFWGGRGIALVTTAQVIDKAVMPGLEQYYRQKVVSNVAANAFEERNLVGKGIGLVAKRFVRQGELLICEPPSLMIHLDMRTDVSKNTRLQMQREAADALPPRTRLETMGLMGHWGGDPIEDRLDTNSFTIVLEQQVDYHALFTQTSRLNHACRPNCFYNFNSQTLTHSVYAIQDIRPGHELTISSTYGERQEMIRSWGFNCSCSACMLLPHARNKSDENIRSIHKYTNDLKDWSKHSQGTPDMGEALVELYEKENLFCHIADGYRLAAHAYSAVRDKYNALRMANKAFGYGLQAWRDMGPRMKDILDLMVDPEAHWTWNQRSGKNIEWM